MLLVIVVALLVIGVWTYAFKIEPYRLTTDVIQIGDKRAKDQIKLVQLSDIELSADYPVDQLEAMVKKVNAQKPDIIVFTGDLFSNYAKYRPVEEVIEYLGDLDARIGKVAIWGNNDYGGGAVRQYQTIIEKAGFTLLKNQSVTLQVDDRQIHISGLDDAQLGRPNLNALKGGSQGADYRILLSHNPEIKGWDETMPFDLVLAGHTHGGQVGVSYLREHFAIESKYRKGFYELEGEVPMFVHSGMGTSRMAVRFMVPPEIVVFTIGLE